MPENNCQINERSLLTEMLTILYTSTQRFNVVSGKIRCWTDVESFGVEYVGNFAVQRSETGSMLDTIVEPGADVEVRNRNGYPGSLTLGFYEMLNPCFILSEMTLSDLAVATKAGRSAVRAIARPRRQDIDREHGSIWDGPEEHELFVDRERGIILSATAYSSGQSYSGKEILDVTFDEPTENDAGSWDETGRVVELLYSARRNFISVSGEVRDWGLTNVSSPTGVREMFEHRHRFWVVNPNSFRMDRFEDDGGLGRVRIHNDDIWWSFSHADNEGATNMPALKLPDLVEVLPGSEVAPAMYEDTEYALAEHTVLNPSWLISGAWFEVLGNTQTAGRSTIEVRAVPRAHSPRRFHWWRGIDQMELSVDAERGLLLRLDAIHNNEKVFGHEVPTIDFDVPIPDDIFQFMPPEGSIIRVRD